MALQSLAEILSAVADNEEWQITPEVLRVAFGSLVAVGGTMYGNDQTLPLTTAWQPFPSFTNSIDTKGLTEDLPNGQFTVQAGADGVYAVDVSLGVFSAFAGWVEIAVTKNGNLTPYRSRRTMTAGGDGVFGIVGSGDLVAGDTVGLAVRGSGTADITSRNAQFRALRI